LIADELQQTDIFISAMIKRKRWWSSEPEPETKAWEEHKHVLAAYLSDEAWNDVGGAMRSLHFAHHLSAYALKVKQETFDDEDAQLVAGLMATLQKGQASLQPYLRQRRLLKPLRVWPRITRPPVLG
jgi:hypothetical protein